MKTQIKLPKMHDLHGLSIEKKTLAQWKVYAQKLLTKEDKRLGFFPVVAAFDGYVRIGFTR